MPKAKAKKIEETSEEEASEEEKAELRKLSDSEVDRLKGKLIEVRRIGAHPIFVSVEQGDTIKQALEKADIPTNEEVKVEALKENSKTWVKAELDDKVFQFDKIAVTTKVSGA